MSYRIASSVLRCYTGPRRALPVLTALADFANDQGIAWPSVAALARLARRSPRRVRENLTSLQGAGWITLVGSRKGGRQCSARWQINLDRLKNPDATVRVSPTETRTFSTLNPDVFDTKPGRQRPPKQLRSYQEAINKPAHARPPRPAPPKTPARNSPVAPLPVWMPAAWQDFVDYRKHAGKGKWTAKAAELNVAKLAELRDQGHDPTAVLHQSIANGWPGLWPLRGNGQGKHKGRQATATALYGEAHGPADDSDENIIDSTARIAPD